MVDATNSPAAPQGPRRTRRLHNRPPAKVAVVVVAVVAAMAVLTATVSPSASAFGPILRSTEIELGGLLPATASTPTGWQPPATLAPATDEVEPVLLIPAFDTTGSVHRYRIEDGSYDGELSPDTGALRRARAIAVGGDGLVYVADADGNQVLRYNPIDNAFVDVFVAAGSGGLSDPRGLAFGPDGNLVVASAGSNQLLEYDGRTGEPVGTVVDDGLNNPGGLAFSDQGHLIATSQNDDAVHLYVDGKLHRSVDVGPGSGPVDVALDSEGRLFIALIDGSRIDRVDLKALESPRADSAVKVESVVTTDLVSPSSVAIGPDGDLWAADQWTDRVVRFDGASGRVLDVVIESEAPFGPTDIAFYPDVATGPVRVPGRGTPLGNGAKLTAADWLGRRASTGRRGGGGLRFEANDGKAEPDLDFVAHGRDYGVVLGGADAIVSPDGSEANAIRLDFVDTADDPAPRTRPSEAAPSVVYEEVYPGIDVTYRDNTGDLEYLVTIEPGADPDAVSFDLSNTTDVELTPSGSLLIWVPSGGAMELTAPVAYQERDGVRLGVESRFELRPDGTIGFEVGSYDPALPLVIDPTFRASTSATSGGGSITIARPAGVTADDVLLASIAQDKNSPITPPSGWILVRSDARSDNVRQDIFYKVASGSEPASYVFNIDNEAKSAGAIAAYDGVDSTNPIDAHGGQGNGESSNYTAPSITTTTSGAMLVAFFANAKGSTTTPPVGMTERADRTSEEIATEIADELLGAAGSTGVRTAGGSSSENVGQLVALTPDSVAGRWRLDEGSGTTATDFSGNGHDGTITAATYTAGVSATGLDFTGGSGERVVVGDPPDGSLDPGTGDFTVSAWFRTTVKPGSGEFDQLVYKSDGSEGYELFLADGGASPRLTFRMRDGGSSWTALHVAPVDDGAWHHAAGVMDGSNLHLYLDGTLVDTQPHSATDVDTVEQLAFGAEENGLAWSDYEGDLDEISLYNRALTAGEIVDLAGTSSIVVNSTGDASDGNPGDDVCDTGGTVGSDPECTLRAAIQEANASATVDTIHFGIPTSDIGYSAAPVAFTIQPGSLLPEITTAMTIDGSTQAEHATEGRPVIEVDGVGVSAGEENGLWITGGGSTVRGLVLNRWGDDAIDLEFNGGNTIVGNYVGTDVTGMIARPNLYGINIKTTGNTIGGTAPSDRNVVSGNTLDGLWIYTSNATGNDVAGNYVGVATDGAAPLGNDRYGMYIHSGANANTIGGATVQHGNVVSGNGSGDAGVMITGASTSGNILRFNKVGTNAAGTASVANNLHGIRVDNAPNTQILDNLISGNDVHGVYVFDSGSTGTQIFRNTIGTNAAQTAALPNAYDGIRLEGGSSGTVIGTVGNGNVIAGNTQDGITINDNNDTVIQANYIGTNSGATQTLGNGGHGIFNEVHGSSNNLIGGDGPGEGNTIAHNNIGVVLDSGTGNTVIGNDIYSNTSLGIDLDLDGVTGNDSGDGDSGPNDLLNNPVITSASETAGTVTVDFDLDVPANPDQYRVEFFSNPSGTNAGGNYEAESFVSAVTTSAGTGLTHSFAGSAGDVITATATRIDTGASSGYSSTSEISAPYTVPTCIDTDGDGLCDINEDANTDADNDPATNPGPDTDADTLPNYLDADDDGDGIPTAGESADPNGDGDARDALDSDRDGQADYLDDPTIAANGTVGSQQKISETSGGLASTLTTSDHFGRSIASIGDLDGDGVGDIAVGAPFDNDGSSDRGAVYVLFLNADGTVRAEQKISHTAGGLVATLDNSDEFGIDVAGLGDLDGDGVNDIAVGAHQDDDGTSNFGAIYILFLNTDGTVKAEQKISDTVGGLSATPGVNDRFGSSVANIGDLDGDGLNDIVVGAKDDDDGAVDQGAVFVLFLNADGTVRAEQKISETSGGLTATLDTSDAFGISVAGPGDVDGDGIEDIAVGAKWDDDGSTNRGAVYVLFLNADGTVRAEQKISDTAGGLVATLDNSDEFGTAVGGVGDVDADGTPDLVVGTPFDDDGASLSGAAYLLFLNPNGTVRAEQKISNLEGNLGVTLDGSDQFGYGLAGIGDHDDDGTIGLAIGAYGDDDGGPADRGAVYVVDLAAAVVAVPPTALSFQQGVDGYSGTVDTWISSNVASQDNSAAVLLEIDNSPVQHGLIRFDNIIGSGPGQIPTGATIVSAELTFEATDPSAADASLYFHRMLRSWVETDTWSSLTSGISTDDVEASSATDTVHTGGLDLTYTPITIGGLESAVQAWADGDANQGWFFTLDRDDGWDTHSSENATVAARPRLDVTYVTGPVTFVVNSTGDGADTNPGDAVCDTGGTNSKGNAECTLRAAIQEANALPTADVIDFAMPATEPGHSGGVWTISPGSPLASLSDAVTLDGSTQTGWTATPVVELNGASAGASTDGLRITADDVTIRNLAINRFGADGVEVASGAANTTIAGNHLGLDAGGTIDRGNGARGIDLGSGSGPTTVGGSNAADRNVVSGNGIDGIVVWNSDANTVIGNYIGTDVTGNAPQPNAQDGIKLGGTSSNNIIGQSGAGNVLSGNGNDGLELDNDLTGNVIQANTIGLGADGSTEVANARYGVVVYDGVNNTQVGGSGAGEGNVISANTSNGIMLDGNANPATASNTIEGNLIGTDETGTLDRGNGGAGIYFYNGANTNTVGGATAGHRNVISGNGTDGIYLQNAGTTGNVIKGNYIGVDSTGNTALPNVDRGVQIESGADNTIVGGSLTGEGNVISANRNDGIIISDGAVPGTGTTGTVIEGNLIGVGVDGVTALGNGTNGVRITTEDGHRIGGVAVGAGNTIAHNGGRGVDIQNSTASANPILANSIHSNTNIGIDLGDDGVTANDGGDGDSGANDLLNYPLITSAEESAGTVTVGFDLDVPAGDYRVEFYTSPTEGADPTGYGEGESFVHSYDVLTHPGGLVSYSTNFAGAAGDVVTSTATTDLGGGAYGSTSEFSMAATVVQAYSISGTVFEDVAGDILSDGVVGDTSNPAAAGVDIHLYLDGDGDGVAEASDSFLATVQTDGNGAYSFSGLSNGKYFVVVDSTSVKPSAGTANPTAVWAEQTYGPAFRFCADGSGGTVVATPAGPCYGGRRADVSDDLTTWYSGAEHLASVPVAGADATGVDYGFSFNVVTNLEGIDATSAQGSLRRFIDNANAVAGPNTMRFVPADATNGSDGSGNTWWSLTPTVTLPMVTDADTVLDATSYDAADGTTAIDPNALGPELELNGSGVGGTGLELAGTDGEVRGFVINRFATGIAITGGSANTVAGNYIGTGADGVTGGVGNTSQGVRVAQSAGNVIGGISTTDRNLVSGNRQRGIAIDDWSDGAPVTSGGTRIINNYIGVDRTGTGTVAYDGIPQYQQIGVYVLASSNTIIGTPSNGNVISGNPWYGIYLWGSDGSGNVIQNNIIGLDSAEIGSIPNGTESSTRGGVYLADATGTLVGGTGAGEGNTIATNGFFGLVAHGASAADNTILGNTIYGNGDLGVELNLDGVTANDAGDGDNGPNDLLNFPVITSAIETAGTVTFEFDLDVPAGDYRVEVFSNPSEGADPSGFGEGETLVAAQTVTHTGSGSESFVLAVPAVFTGDVLTATANEDLGGGSFGATSEFSAAVTVSTDTVRVLDASVRRSDVFADGGLDPASAATTGTAGSALTFNGGGDLLRGPGLDLTDTELSVSAWVRPASLGGTDYVVSKRTSGGDPVYELGVDGASGQAVASLTVGGAPVVVQGGTITAGTWHHVAVTWDGTTVLLYVDGTEVDTALASGSLATDVTTDVTIGNRSDGSAGFDGEIDHVEIGHVAPTAAEVALRHSTVAEQALTVAVGQQQTGVPGAWVVSGVQSRSGGFALAAPETADSGAAAWAVATGIDEPGAVFESWWWASTATGVDLASGTRAGQSPTDQFDAGYVGADTWSMRRRSGAVTSVDGSGAQTLSAGSWVKVEQWTDQNGNSRLLVDGVEVAPWTAQTAPPASGSLGLRVGQLPGGQRWFVDDPRARRLVMPEPTATLGPLDRD